MRTYHERHGGNLSAGEALLLHEATAHLDSHVFARRKATMWRRNIVTRKEDPPIADAPTDENPGAAEDDDLVSVREINGGAWTRTTDLGIMRPSL